MHMKHLSGLLDSLCVWGRSGDVNWCGRKKESRFEVSCDFLETQIQRFFARRLSQDDMCLGAVCVCM